MIDLSPMLACFPATVIGMMKMSMVVSALSTGVSFLAQSQAAKEKKKWQDYNADIARRAAQQKSSAVIAQNILNKEATARKQQAAAQEGEAAIADAKASIISGGVSGLSMEHLISNIEAQKGQYHFALEQEQEMRDVETGRQLENVALQAEGQLAQIQRPIQGPNIFAHGLKMAGDFATQRGSYYKELKARAIQPAQVDFFGNIKKL